MGFVAFLIAATVAGLRLAAGTASSPVGFVPSISGFGRLSPGKSSRKTEEVLPPVDNDLVSFFDAAFEEAGKKLLKSHGRVVDMIPPSDSVGYELSKPLRQELFASPLISALYERVLPPLWKAGLRIGGPDAEYASAIDFLGRSGEGGGAVLDLSCGTGFVARRLASSGRYDRVFALDYSDQMLGELCASLSRDGEREDLPLYIIRGDAGSLPFRSESLDAVHWGAAMHCVPSAERALKEVHRVLKPGGKLYATTFLRPFPDVVFRFFTVEEIASLATDSGFGADMVEVESRGVYGILRTMK